MAEAIAKTAETFGGIDIVVNNASAISLTNTQMTDMKRFDLMHQINTRGTFMVSKYAIPHLEKAENPHILMLSPPLDMKTHWFAPHLAYSIAKYGMSLCVLGLAGELAPKGIAVNALWPRTTIATAAVQNLLGGDKMVQASRTPEILADAAHMIFSQALARVLRQLPDRRQLHGRRGRHRLHPLSRRPIRAADAGLLRARPTAGRRRASRAGCEAAGLRRHRFDMKQRFGLLRGSRPRSVCQPLPGTSHAPDPRLLPGPRRPT